MPLEESLRPAISANWSFTEFDREQRIIQFKDASTGQITKRRWDFGEKPRLTKKTLSINILKPENGLFNSPLKALPEMIDE